MRPRYKLQYVCAVGLALMLPVLAWAAAVYKGFDYKGIVFGTKNDTATITEAFGINEQGTIVGSFCADKDPAATTPGCSAPGNAPSHGYVKFNGNNFKAINFPGAFETEATSISPNGTIVGLYDPKIPKPANADTGKGYFCTFSSSKGCTNFHTVVFPGSASTDLQSINGEGDIVGLYALKAIPPFLDFGFLLDDGQFCTVDLGLLPAGIAGAADTNTLSINDKGDIVGSYDDPNTGVTAFLITDVEVHKYQNGKPAPCTWTKLTTFTYQPDPTVLQTEAAGINDDGLIVGNYLDSNQVSHAFSVQSLPDGTLDTTSFKSIDFQPPQGGDNAATSVNDKGVIVGNYEDTTTKPGFTKERAWVLK
jgi:uncharacterized membrane protein